MKKRYPLSLPSLPLSFLFLFLLVICFIMPLLTACSSQSSDHLSANQSVITAVPAPTDGEPIEENVPLPAAESRAVEDHSIQSDSTSPAFGRLFSSSIDTFGLVSENGALQVLGTQLCNELGHEIQLKGMSSHGIQWFPEFATYKTMKEIRDSWNANVFRIAMYTDTDTGYLKKPTTNKKKVVQLINAAIDLDMYVIVDWHILSDGNPTTHQKEAIRFFSAIAKKYANVPNVIYEICNEPNGNVSWSQDIKPYATQVISSIRKYSPYAVIIVGTPNWSQDVDIAAKDPIQEKNIMYALHFYAGTHGKSLRKKIDTALSQDAAIFVSEWGTSAADGNGKPDLKESKKWLKYLDSHGISWCNWSLCNKEEASAALKKSASPDGNWSDKDLTESGLFVKDAILSTPFTPLD